MAEKLANSNRLIEHLLKTGLVSKRDVLTATRRQKEFGGDLIEVLVGMDLIDESQLARGLASFYSLSPVNLTRVRVSKKALASANPEFCRRHQVMPFGIDSASGNLLVAVANPARIPALDALRARSGGTVRAYVAPYRQLRDAIEFYYFGDSSKAARKAAAPIRPTSERMIDPAAIGGGPDLDSGIRSVLPDSTSGLRALSMSQPEDIYQGRLAEDSTMHPAIGPGTEDFGSLPHELGESGGVLGRRPEEFSVTDSSTHLGPLNPFSQGTDSAVTPSAVRQEIERLREAVRRLEQALRYEMSVSQALAEVLVENGLISSEQLKTRLRRR